MAKEFTFRGKKIGELKQMSLEEFVRLIPSKKRRSLSRGLTSANKRLLDKIRKTNSGNYKKPIRTPCRDMVVIPEMIDMTIHIHNGKSFINVKILPEMLGHTLGEFVTTRQKIKHSAPGIGATRSSAAVSVK